MTDDQFRELCNTFGFAPSRALRELLDKAMEQEREACAKVCDARCVEDGWEGCYADACAAAIRARSNT